MPFFRKNWQVVSAIVLTYIFIFFFWWNALSRTDGIFIYPLDDVYIHMAVAKNFSQNWVWGVTKYGFSSVSSSLLWPFLIALVFKIFGVGDFFPLVMNLLLVVPFAIVLDKILRQWGVSQIGSFVVIILIVLVTPAVYLVSSGMEHFLQAIVSLLFVNYAVEYLSSENPEKSLVRKIVLVSSLGMLVRYEFFLLIGIWCFLAIARGRRKDVFKMVAIPSAIPVIYGIISLFYGWLPLPSSVLVKGGAKFLSLLTIASSEWFQLLLASTALVMLIILVWCVLGFLLAMRRVLWEKSSLWGFLSGSAIIVHLLTAGISLRYEAYLFPIGILSIVIMWQDLKKIVTNLAHNTLARICVGVVLSTALGLSYPRFKEGNILEVISCQNIYHQQYQMARFLKLYYDGEPVGINDIGAISYYTNCRILDFAKIASVDMLKYLLVNKRKELEADEMELFARMHNVKIALIYEIWFPNVPRNWVKVALWRIPNNQVCASDRVTFFATDSISARKLAENVVKYSKIYLPKEVKAAAIRVGG